MSLIQDSLTLFKREMLIFRANLRTNIARSAIFPIFIILIFGSINSTFKNVPIAVVNDANNKQATTFLNDLQINNNVQIQSVTNEQTALSQLETGSVQLVVIILPTFPSTTPGTAGIQVYYTNTQVTVAEEILPLINASADKASGLASDPSSASAPQAIVQANALYAESASYRDFLAAGIIPMVVVFSALFGGGISLISDRQLGNLKAFFITPINKNAIILGRVLSGSVQGTFAAVIALGVGLAFGAGIAMGAIGVLYLLFIAFIVSMGFTAIALILAARIKRVDAYAIFSQSVGLPLWYVAGGITPVASLPGWLAPLSAVDPLTYATQVTRDVMMQGFIPINILLTDVGLIVLFGGILILIAMMSFKSTLD